MKQSIFLTLLIQLWFILGLIGQEQEAFFNFEYSDEDGKLHVYVDDLNQPFLMVNAISSGLGSNDVGLDRGKLMDTRLVKFEKYGHKLLLIQPNQKYRANSKNMKEVEAVEQAFAQSVLASFEIVEHSENGYKIDFTPYLLSDVNGISRILKDQNQGSYKLSKTKSVINPETLLGFPKNTVWEALLTFDGEAKGQWVRSVSPTAESITLGQVISFIELPDDQYQPRPFHPYSGYFSISYADYAVPIDHAINQQYITRHRLQKQNPDQPLSEAVKPIVYFVDSGCPEPVKSALIEGASWWNEAFEAAGFKNAFMVKELPKDAHPLDVRYNVIQWVHRSTRGWSYGASVVDPRTGEIIKGHVSLGSLRVRQNFMIAQGILSPYAQNGERDALMQMALARLRQLSAHEVGHTLGLAHNFAASTNDRSSVMDYPHPFITYSDDQFDFSNAYDENIGAWDKRAIIYGYAEVDGNVLENVLEETVASNLRFISDPDARPQGSAHPYAHLWDNGADPIAELNRIMEVRSVTLQNFGTNTIKRGTPFSELSKILVPAYLMHRYQVEAAVKWIGGVDYNYAVKGLSKPLNEVVPYEDQEKALTAILNTLSAKHLKLPEHIQAILLPQAYGYANDRESFEGFTGPMVDHEAMADAYIHFVYRLLFNEQRLSRLHQQGNSKKLMEKLVDHIFNLEDNEATHQQIQRNLVIHILKLHHREHIEDPRADQSLHQLMLMMNKKIYQKGSTKKGALEAHWSYLSNLIQSFNKDPKDLKLPTLPSMPPGSPIGCH